MTIRPNNGACRKLWTISIGREDFIVIESRIDSTHVSYRITPHGHMVLVSNKELIDKLELQGVELGE